MAQIQVYREDTGDKVWIPKFWMDHPVLSRGFRTLPSERDAENQAPDGADETSESAAPDQSTTPTTPTPTTATRGSTKNKE